MKLDELIAIDVHTHAEVSCRCEPDEAWKPFEEASAKYFKAGKRPTIADIGIYGVLRYAPEANIDLSHYPNVTNWKKRFEQLPGFATPEELLPMESRLI